MIDKYLYENYVSILKSELLPAMGCTEPIAVAYAAAKARAVLGVMPEKIKVYCSGNIIKNVMGVTVPNSGGQKGVDVAAILGVVGGREDQGLEVLSKVTGDQIEEVRGLVKTGFAECYLAETDEKLYIRAEVFKGDESALVEIKTKHDHISRIEKNGVVLESTPEVKTEVNGDKSLLNLKDIKEFADTVDLDDIKEIISRQIECNCSISKEGLENSWGASVGKTILENSKDDLGLSLSAVAAAGSDARMGGCALPVVINSGSGNQGITITVPVVRYAEKVGCGEERLYRALVFANLVSLHEKYYIGDLSAYCGAVSAGSAAASGIAYIDGASLEVIGKTIINSICTIGGMVCDGAKPSCAAKIASSVNTGIVGYEMAKKGRSFVDGEGLVGESVEETIKNVGRMGREGMKATDIEILNIMLGH